MGFRGEHRGFCAIYRQGVVGVAHGVGAPSPRGGFLSQFDLLGLSYHLHLAFHCPSLMVGGAVGLVKGLRGGGGQGGWNNTLRGAGFGGGGPAEVGSKVGGVPEGGLLHDAACLAVEGGAVAAVTYWLVVQALSGGQTSALRGWLLGLGMWVGL